MAVRRRRRKSAKAKKRNIPTNKKLYARIKAKVKRKFAVYPSAYANASLVKQYKAAGGKYRRG
jgi:disulfide oxidoreductase YuzD|tara:strand:+ start:136 stop:324 length:189 start_codon:yes stop_codon:yes gene_type:complete